MSKFSVCRTFLRELTRVKTTNEYSSSLSNITFNFKNKWLTKILHREPRKNIGQSLQKFFINWHDTLMWRKHIHNFLPFIVYGGNTSKNSERIFCFLFVFLHPFWLVPSYQQWKVKLLKPKHGKTCLVALSDQESYHSNFWLGTISFTLVYFNRSVLKS